MSVAGAKGVSLTVSYFQIDQWSAKRWIIALVLLSLATMTPGFFSIPPVDRDETRFSQATRQMVASGDYIDIQFQDGKRYKKPIGIYWLQAASVHLVGGVLGDKAQAPIWAYRLPSLLAMIAAVLLTFAIARQFLTVYGAGIAGIFIALCILPGFEARIAKVDAVLLAVVLVAQFVLARSWLNLNCVISHRLFFVFWGAVGFGILLKGPVILLVTGLTIFALCIVDRSVKLFRHLRPLHGFVVALTIALPWFIAISIKSDGAFLIEAGLVDFLGKVASVKESHGGFPGLYALVMTGTFWPASLFLLAAAPFIFNNRRDPAILFGLAWALPSWIIFELTPTKLPHYVLPLYPALALMTAYAIEKGLLITVGWRKMVACLLFVIPAVLVIVCFGGLIYFEGVFSPVLAVAGVASVAFSYLAWKKMVLSSSITAALPLIAVSCIALYLAVYEFAFPKLQTIWISNRLVIALEAHKREEACPSPSVIAVGYHEPSLALLGPLDLRFENAENAVQKLEEASCRQLFLTKRQEEKMRILADERNLDFIALETVKGFKLNGGDDVAITLYGVVSNRNKNPS